jgi:hypothetical protein
MRMFSVMVNGTRSRFMAEDRREARRVAASMGADESSMLEMTACGWTPVN